MAAAKSAIPGLGGKIVVTGIGKVDEDEFALSLLNEQELWTSIVLATDNSVSTQKRFLSRTARYSGLLNLLNFETVDVAAADQLSAVLEGANAWVAFNVSQAAVPQLSEAALKAGVKRAVFTVELPPARINETFIAELDAAAKAFEAAGAYFTGIRHGTLVEGDEDNPYEIVNATVPCMENFVERGVLARVTAELLLIDKSVNAVCGVSSSSQFAAAYLDVLRSSGLNRQQEVTKMYSGGLQRVARLTVTEYEARQQRAEEKKARDEQRKIEQELELEKEKAAQAARMLPVPTADGGPRKQKDPNASITPGWDEEEDEVKEVTDEEKVKARADEILKAVWQEYDTRMYAKSTAKGDFYDQNRPMAIELATKELDEEKARKQETEEEKAAQQRLMDQVVEVSRKQYAKLLTLERKEMQNQKEISDTWVKYIYLLLESLLARCKETGTLFHNVDEYAQTLLLRQQANALRAECQLPPYEVIYDPLDASVVVAKLAVSPLGQQLGLSRTGDEVAAELTAKHGNTLKTITALRGASQIIELAIDTLRMELPPKPPSVNELRRSESLAKQQLVSQARLEGIKNRGKPKSNDEDSGVGRL
jgi:hypothetical protein